MDDENSELENPFSPPVSYSDENTFGGYQLIGDPNPLISIWLHPRVTISRLASDNPNLYVLPLICLAGICFSLERASSRSAGDTLSFSAILILACTMGPLGTLFGVWVGAQLLASTGRWLGGLGDYQLLRTAIAWSWVPRVVSLMIWVPLLLVGGADCFTEATPRLDAQPILAIVFAVLGLAQIVLSIWSFVLMCNTVAEVQGFGSAWMGFLNLLISGLVFILVILVVAFVVFGILRIAVFA